ncbi:hypothetical protein [Xenophilus sp. Marseille-Q4582]|uniref:hypothetical protein n=1 Tax=Xenophilus sp. Marseille-Q4582 TaxID=2866600 RepID=UPI001CE3F885|nr:hypothetical protein [Xenophilus sp. Marseille-Q4582]
MLLETPFGPPPPAPDLPPGMPPPSPFPEQPPEVDPPPGEPPVEEPGREPPVADPPLHRALGRVHARRLRELHRSAGWPCGDLVEVELLAAGLLTRERDASGHETLRLSDAGIAHLAQVHGGHRARLTAHEALVEQVARQMTRNGRLAWRGLRLRARLPAPQALAGAQARGLLEDTQGEQDGPARWCIACPDVFSIRNTSVEAYCHPLVHEIKVSRADLLGDLRKADKRAAYLDLGGECWYVLGQDAKGRAIAAPEEVPEGCGVLMQEGPRLVVARAAVYRPVQRLPFAVWMALARAQPMPGFDEDAQDLLVPCH